MNGFYDSDKLKNIEKKDAEDARQTKQAQTETADAAKKECAQAVAAAKEKETVRKQQAVTACKMSTKLAPLLAQGKAMVDDARLDQICVFACTSLKTSYAIAQSISDDANRVIGHGGTSAYTKENTETACAALETAIQTAKEMFKSVP